MNKTIPIAVVLLSCVSGAWGNSRHHTPKMPDLFETFHQLDDRFAQLDTEFKELQESVNSHSNAERLWRDQSREVRKTTIEIQRVSYRMCVRYRRAGRKIAYKSFAKLSHDARRLRMNMARIASTKTMDSARRQTRVAKLAMVDLVLQYQALSGGYAAARCEANTWICGTPKPEPRKIGYPVSRMKWGCVQHSTRCRGLLGPRAPQLTPEPLTAGPIQKTRR